MTMENLTGVQIKALFLSGRASAVEIAAYFMKRIADYDPLIRAFLWVNAECVMAKAELLDEKRSKGVKLGRLAAIPIGIKDSLCMKGALATAGSLCLQNYTAPWNAAVVQALENADALLLGKTNLDEFGMGSTTERSAFQLTKNPHDLKRSPGGSSGGSAAAVAAGLCPIALGTDAGGSIRQPAAWCGVMGFKPSFGSVSNYGLLPGRSTLEQIGPLAHSIEDIVLMMEVMSPIFQTVEAADYKAREAQVIAVAWSALGDLSPDLYNCFQQEIKRLESRGVKIRSVDLPSLVETTQTYRLLFAAEAAPLLARYQGLVTPFFQKNSVNQPFAGNKQVLLGEEVRKRQALGLSILSQQYPLYLKALNDRKKISAELSHILLECDCIAMPTTPFSASVLDEKNDLLSADLYTQLANLAKLPAISLPLPFTTEKLPVGFQLIGRYQQDRNLLRIAADLY